MKQSAEQRLNSCCEQLKEDGVKDVKFCFAQLSEKPLSRVANDAAEVLSAIINKQHSGMKPLGDSQRRQSA